MKNSQPKVAKFEDLSYGSHFYMSDGQEWIKLQDLLPSGNPLRFRQCWIGETIAGEVLSRHFYNAVRISDGYVGSIPRWIECSIVLERKCCPLERERRQSANKKVEKIYGTLS